MLVEDVDMRGTETVLRASGSVNMTVRSATGANPVEGTRPTCVIENDGGAVVKSLVETSTSGKLTIEGCLVTRATGSGVYKAGTGDLDLIRTDLNDNGTTRQHYGLFASGSGTVRIVEGDVRRNFGAGIVGVGSVSMTLQSPNVRDNGEGRGRTPVAGYVPVSGDAGLAYWSTGDLTLERSPTSLGATWFQGNGHGGVAVLTGSGPTTQKMLLDSVTIIHNDGAAAELDVDFAGQLTVRKSIIKSGDGAAKNYGAVVVRGTPSSVDFGRASAPADDVFTSEGSGASPVLVDLRPAVASACSTMVAPNCNPLYVCGSTLNGSAPAASIVSGPVVGPLAASVASYEIKHANRRVAFCQ